jgi:putative transposase
MLRRRLPKNVRPSADEWEILLRLGRAIGNKGVAALITVVSYSSWVRRLRQANLAAGAEVRPPSGKGRHRTPEAVCELVRRLARENPTWGYTRILGELRKLKVRTSRSNVVNILRRDGRDPRLDPTQGTWAHFLRAHAATLWQCDFFWKYASTADGALRKCFALAFVHVESRRVWVSPCTFHPTFEWVTRQGQTFVARAAAATGLPPPGIVLRDNDKLYPARFDAAIAAGGGEVKRLALRSPNTNAYAERFVQAVKRECLDKFVLFGPEHMGHLVREYVEHYHTERPHQGKGNAPLNAAAAGPAPPPDDDEDGEAGGEVRCRERLGGVLRHYYRAATAAA